MSNSWFFGRPGTLISTPTAEDLGQFEADLARLSGLIDLGGVLGDDDVAAISSM